MTPLRCARPPSRLYLSPFDLTPTYREVHNKYSVRYFLNLVLVDEEDRRCVGACVLPVLVLHLCIRVVERMLYLVLVDEEDRRCVEACVLPVLVLHLCIRVVKHELNSCGWAGSRMWGGARGHQSVSICSVQERLPLRCAMRTLLAGRTAGGGWACPSVR